MKQIITNIDNCEQCPHNDHTGGFTQGGAKPTCGHPETIDSKGHDCFLRVIPYFTTRRGIHMPKMIPAWCPLNDAPKN